MWWTTTLIHSGVTTIMLLLLPDLLTNDNYTFPTMNTLYNWNSSTKIYYLELIDLDQ